MLHYLSQITNYLLTQSWQIALIVLVLAALSLALKNKSAHVKYLLWLIVLAKSLVPPLVTLPLAILPQERLADTVMLLPAERPIVANEIINTAPTEHPISFPTQAPTERTTRLTVRQWLGLGWIIGVTMFVLIAVIKAFRTNIWIRQKRRPLPTKMQVKIEELFSNLNIRSFPKIWLIEGIGQPFVWGLLRGSIYLPADFIKVHNAEHRRGILGHELSHVLRFDAAVNFLQVVAQAIFWFHPFVWWANKKIRAEREKCCDEMAIARLDTEAKEYSTAIVNILISGHDRMRPVPSLAIAGPVKNIEERIKTMLRPGKKFYKRPGIIIVITVLLTAALVVPTTLALTARKSNTPSETIENANLQINDVKFEPIRQGKNVVRVKMQNTSAEEQIFRLQIYTRSPDYGRDGVGWGTSFFDSIKPKETKWTRFVFKIQGPITNSTYVRLDFHNPGPAASFDIEKWSNKTEREPYFKRVKYLSSDLERYEPSKAQVKQASKKQADAVIQTFRKIQGFIRDKKYEQAWKLFTNDYQDAEFQFRANAFERFKKAMEPTHPLNSAFLWEKDDFLSLQPQNVVEKNSVFTLTATTRDQMWTIDFIQENGQWKIDWIGGYTPAIIKNQLAEQQQSPELEILDVKLEPIRQGKNVVHAEVRNTSSQDQVLAVYIQTWSPSRGWGTTFIDTIKAGQTKQIRHAYKIFDRITGDTWIRLQFYNPGPAAGFDRDKWFSSEPWDSWFKKLKYFGNDLEHYKTGESQLRPASKSQSQAITKVLRQLQDNIKSKDYQAAWQLFTQDFREAEFQIRGFERFKECMKRPQNFYLSSTDILALEPKTVNRRNAVFTLTAAVKDALLAVNFVEVEGRWKIDSIEHIDIAAEKVVDGQDESQLEVLDVKIDPIRQGKNVVNVEVKNNSEEDQMFRIQIYTYSPGVGGWGTSFFDTIKASETKWTRHGCKIRGPIADGTYIRLDFHNPGSAASFDMEKWKQKIGRTEFFKRVRYNSSDLEHYKADRSQIKSASKGEADAVIKTLQQIQDHIKNKEYESAWSLFTQDFKEAEFAFSGFEGFKQQMEIPQRYSLGGIELLALEPKSVTRQNDVFVLTAAMKDKLWTVDFVQAAGQYKLDSISGLISNDWQERFLPLLEKRTTKHFDIYYFKDSTAEKEIAQIVKEKERGFEQICQFLGRDSDVRIRMVFFEDGETKQRATGHQGMGWATGNTIVEIYNEREKLDPYHETTHILMRPYGNPPALFNEGFAVYMSERLGAQALKNLGGGEATIYQRVKELKKNNEWIELEELLTYTEIGSSQTRPPISYAEAASFVKFLIDKYGKNKFLQAYKTLRNSDNKSVQQQNIKVLEQIYGQSLKQLEQKWLDIFSKD